MSSWHALHYNAVAKEIRELFPLDKEATDVPLDEHVANRVEAMYVRTVLTVLATNFAKRFYNDSDRFDPIKFLDACSPNPDVYPLSELWDIET